ncbi:phospholipid ABC transporter ATP-binding protein MlaF, partial [Erwinia amylovora]|nr:phospholipid ABC transporter ATP-binding protein MlaF [Erwinia amylovora]
QDPITMCILVKLIDERNHSIGETCNVLSHDEPEVLSMAEYAYIIDNQKVIAHGTASDLRKNDVSRVLHFIDGIADWPVPLLFPAG